MVKLRPSLLVCACLTVTGAAFAQSSYVFQLPGLAQAAHAPQVEGVGDNNFGRILGPLDSNNFSGANKVIATPSASKFYVLTPNGLFSANSTLGATTPVSSITGAVSNAVITPDGLYLLVVAGNHFYILNTATDALTAQPDTGVPSGATAVDVTVSHDAKTAWILATANTGSTVTAMDLTSFQAAPSQLNLLSGATSLVLSPGGLLYVTSAANRLYEIDPTTMSVTTFGQITLPGLAGPLQFTPDGTAAYFVNQTVCGSCSPIFKLTVQTHSISTWFPTDGSAPPAVDQVLVAGNNRVFGYSAATTQLWDISPAPLGLTPSALGATLQTSTVAAVAVSNENPSSRFLYLLITNHSFQRVNLATNGVDQQTTLDPVDGTILQFVSIPPTSGGASLSLFNGSQNVVPSATVTLIAQVLDSVGRPVFGASVSFSANPSAGIAITNPTVTTTAGGWAQTTITAPATAGNYVVNVTSVGGLSASFLVNVNSPGSGGNTGGTGTPQMSIYAGDGQLLRQHSSTAFSDTHVPLTVLVVDAMGNPLPNVAVTFAVESGGIGTVNPQNQGLTDASGLARADYTSDNLPNQDTVLLTKVAASSVYGTVEFFEETHDAPVNALKPPNSVITKPSNSRLIPAPQGGLLVDAIEVQTFAEDTGLFIPNVGLRLADPTNISNNSTIATCQGLSRSDTNGISTCNMLVTSCQVGDFGAVLYVGENIGFAITIRVTRGTPALITPVSALSQTGKPGTSFTLVARVSDGCGQPIAASGLNWGLLQGSAPAQLVNPQTSSDSGGTITTQVTLGQTAGTVQVQLSGPSLTPIVFNITNQVSLSGISLVSGGGQSVTIGQQFQPLVFVVHDSNNNPIQGALVTFSVTGSATINPGSATTNLQGQVQTIVTAGATGGTIVVTASASNLTATATLSAHASGPQLITTSFSNAASGAVGMVPCGIVTVSGSGIAPGIQGVVVAANFFGLMPYTLAGLSITVNNTPVPIQSVANDQFGQHANFQAPCELTGSSATVVVTVNGASTTITGVNVLPVQPAIFTSGAPSNKLYGAVIREVDGTFVTAANPARQGEKLYLMVTGLGQTTPALITNSAGTGSQTVNLPVAVFLSGTGLPALSATYLFGSIGTYLVEFQVPSNSPVGLDQPLLVVAVVNNGQTFVTGNTVLLANVVASGTGTGGGGTNTGTGGTGTGGTGTGGTGTGGTGTGGTGTGGTGTGGTGTGGTGTGGTGTGGTGTGGTGTGGTGTGTSSALAPTQDEINSWIARGNYVSGQLSLSRNTTFTTTDNPGQSPTTSTTKTDSFFGQFTKTSGSDLSKLLNNQLPAGFPVLVPAVGSCSVYSISSLTNPFPNLTTVNLDAGPQLTSNGPNGTQLALRLNGLGVGFTYSASNVPNTYLAAGQYALSGPGGADVGAFSGNLNTVADLVVTNPSNFSLINRSGGVTVNWTGGEQSNLVFISGSSATLNGATITGNAFICSQNVSAGQFTVPASILAQLRSEEH